MTPLQICDHKEHQHSPNFPSPKAHLSNKFNVSVSNQYLIYHVIEIYSDRQEGKDFGLLFCFSMETGNLMC